MYSGCARSMPSLVSGTMPAVGTSAAALSPTRTSSRPTSAARGARLTHPLRTTRSPCLLAVTAPFQAIVALLVPATIAVAIRGNRCCSSRASSMFSASGKASRPALAAATTGTANDSGRSRPPTSSAATTPSKPSPASCAPCSATLKPVQAATARDAVAANSAGDNPSSLSSPSHLPLDSSRIRSAMMPS